MYVAASGTHKQMKHVCSCAGLLHVRKLPGIGALSAKVPEVCRLALCSDAVYALHLKSWPGMPRLSKEANLACDTVAHLCACTTFYMLGASGQRHEATQLALQVARFVVRHRRRKLGIEAVDIDPDAEARLDAATRGSGSAAAMLCGGPAKADKPFDF